MDHRDRAARRGVLACWLWLVTDSASTSTPLGDALLCATIAVSIVLLGAPLLYAVMARTRRRERRMKAGSLTVWRTISIVDGLTEAFEVLSPNSDLDSACTGWQRIGWTYSLVLQKDGLSIYGGDGEPFRVAVVPWPGTRSATAGLAVKDRLRRPALILEVDVDGRLVLVPLLLLGAGPARAFYRGRRAVAKAQTDLSAWHRNAHAQLEARE
ncbi:hypothetical protein E6C70_00780 [Glaciibacter flavus]|uniref:Uncharacterized protein n=1 Tax=Orlajensenia flava TaxID=2565934 RepID=A0A4S4G0U2_9MICO|nr:hypothetical protein [Glaciibacter flavus]THG36112.1 hypothetical protein E6C70_00780 [Glaciibacter flavus]